jgi:AraC-like DNA-binding protein
MNYTQFEVPAPLTPWVECVWRLTGAAAIEAPAHRVYPDGCLELVIHAGDPFLERAEDGGVRQQPTRLVVGQMVRPVTLEPLGAIDVWGIRFHPWGGGLVFAGSVSALTGRIEQAADVAPDLTRALERAVSEPPLEKASDDARLASLYAALIARIGAIAAPDPLSAHAARRLLRDPAWTSVARLAGEAGLSVRQLERRFLATVGLTPKTFARIARFQQVCTVLDATPEALSAAAVRCGYYDQSHLARDVRDFAGTTPAALRSLDSGLAEHFLRARRMSAFSKIPSPTAT